MRGVMPISHSFYSICDKEKLEQLMNEWMDGRKTAKNWL